MAAQLVTGYAGVAHVSSADAGALNAGILGSGRYVLNIGNKFAYTTVSNNLITIADGDLLNQGRHCRIRVNDTVSCTIENGLSGVKRNDLIVMRYQKDTNTAVESATVVVIKGTSGSTATDPTYNVGNILGNDLIDDFPLYRVRLNGLSIEGVDALFSVTSSIQGKIDDSKRLTTESALAAASAGTVMDSLLSRILLNHLWGRTGKNILPSLAAATTGDGITGTPNTDGSITVNGKSSNATNGYSSIIFTTITLKAGRYILSGCPSGGSIASFFMTVNDYSAGTQYALDTGSGASFELTADTSVYCRIVVMYNVTVTSKVFYPMIRYAEVTDATYEAYCPSALDIYGLAKKVVANHVTTISGNTLAFEATTTIAYTGLSVVIPAGCYYSVQAQAFLNGSKPSTIIINQSPVLATTGIVAEAPVAEYGASCAVCGYNTNELALYVWAKYAAAGTNTINLRGFYIK